MALRLVLVLALLVESTGAAARDPYLVLGQRQYTDGDLEEAVFSLDTAVRKLSAGAPATAQLVDAYVYLGAAYVGLEQETLARKKFLRALQLDAMRQLGDGEFPPRVVKVFDEVRLEVTAARRKRGARTFLILGGIGAAGAVGAGVAFGGRTSANRPPSGSVGVDLEGQAITGVTLVDFRATASDPDGDPLTFMWDFGDGGTAAGQNVSHVFAREGAFNVIATVSDGRGASGTATAAVTARSLNAIWRSNDGPNATSDYQCVQSGTSIDCRRLSSTGPTGPIVTIERYVGTLASPRRIDVQVVYRDRAERCRGEVLRSLDCFVCAELNGGLYRASVAGCH